MQWKVLTKIPRQFRRAEPGCLSPGLDWWGLCETITAWCQLGFSSTLLADSFSMIIETKDWGEPKPDSQWSIFSFTAQFKTIIFFFKAFPYFTDIEQILF